MAYEVKFDEPEVTEIKRGWWRIEKDWTVEYRGEKYTVKAGFETDGASIPWALRLVCGSPFRKPRLYAAILHDWIYDGHTLMLRADADDLYRDMQIGMGVPRWKAYLEWKVLRMFGWSHWEGWVAGVLAGVMLGCAGCVSEEKSFRLDGYFGRISESGFTLGRGEVETVPRGTRYFRASYSEDTAFFSPSTKTHQWDVVCCGGTNWVPEEVWTTIGILKDAVAEPETEEAKDGE